MSGRIGVLLFVLVLVGCAHPPDTSEISEECSKITGLDAELKNQDGKLFKNYDHANHLTELAKQTCKSITREVTSETTNSIRVLGAECINGMLFVYHPNGGVVQVFRRGDGWPVDCK